MTITSLDYPLEPFVDKLPVHCHILEHEDRDMMRPFVTMPGELMRFMGH